MVKSQLIIGWNGEGGLCCAPVPGESPPREKQRLWNVRTAQRWRVTWSSEAAVQCYQSTVFKRRVRDLRRDAFATADPFLESKQRPCRGPESSRLFSELKGVFMIRWRRRAALCWRPRSQDCSTGVQDFNPIRTGPR